ncbi:MAG: HipA N-terminal domain-containing protein [Verrucomicrobiota bacterium]|nr:HipA N-terminal domain-containing protein [Verrucomicrobiota bacterium]
MNYPTGKISAVLVYLERRKSRKLVGELTYHSKEEAYVFQYDKNYLRLKLIPLGPELPLGRKKFISKKLFESFVDRIPSRENPAYKDYCAAEGIDVNEADPFILLTTIGKRGPSSFIFESKRQSTFSVEDLKKFRQELQLTTKEFSIGFSITEKTLISIEHGQTSGKDTMKRLELYARFPALALFEFQRNCASIHREKRRLVEQILSRKINKEE